MSKNIELQHLVDFALFSDASLSDSEDILIALDAFQATNSEVEVGVVSGEKPPIHQEVNFTDVGRILECSRLLQKTSSTKKFSTSFNSIRDYAFKKLKSNELLVLEQKTEGVLPEEFYVRYENSALFSKLEDHYQRSAADHYAHYVLDVICALTRQIRSDDLLFSMSHTSLIPDLSDIPFLCFLMNAEKVGA